MTDSRQEELAALVARKMRRHYEVSVKFALTVWTAANVFCVVAEQTVALPDNRPVLLAARLGALGGIALGALLLRRTTRWRGVVIIAMLIATNVPFALLPYWVAARNPVELPAAVSLYVVQSLFLTIAVPGNALGVVAVGVAYAAAFVLATVPFMDLFFESQLLLLLSLFWVVGLRIFLDVLTRKGFVSEARSELELLPRNHFRDQGEPWQNRSGRVVVLASDWRGYQALTGRLAPQEVAAMLARYYDLCDRLLDEHAQGVPFASDWIADELIVYFPVANDGEEQRAAQAAISFARELIRQKVVVTSANGETPAIDVGIVAGVARLGLFGPDGRQKIVAVGPALVEARRLQTCGKGLRERFGAADRIIYDERVLAATQGTADGSGSGWGFETVG